MVSRGPTVRCPQCGRAHPYTTDNPWRPFCSQRCREIDLGAWANESYRVPARPDPDDPDLPTDDDDGGPQR